jgi:hypothetical protein
MTEDNRRPTLTSGGSDTLEPEEEQPAAVEKQSKAEPLAGGTAGADERRPDAAPARPGGEDGDERSPESRERLKHLGFELVTRLFSASKTVHLYDMNNRAS